MAESTDLGCQVSNTWA